MCVFKCCDSMPRLFLITRVYVSLLYASPGSFLKSFKVMDNNYHTNWHWYFPNLPQKKKKTHKMACTLIDISYCLSSSNCLSNEHSQVRSHYAKYLTYFTSCVCLHVHAELLNPLDIALTPVLTHILLKKH